MMNDKALAQRFLPHFYEDREEPFHIRWIGYQVITRPCRSPSFDREITLPEGAAGVIEYGIFWDYDIQHMYDLEHVWVYYDAQNQVVEAEGSAHGGYLNCMCTPLEDETHVPVYLQPGKHAMFSKARLVELTDADKACNEEAGKMGLHVTDLFRGKIIKEAGIDERVKRYLKEKYSFVPTLDFRPAVLPDDPLVPLPWLLEEIPVRIRELLAAL